MYPNSLSDTVLSAPYTFPYTVCAHTHTHTHTHLGAGLQSTVAPGVGEEGFLQEPHTLSVVLKCLPREVRSAGSRRQAVAHTCLDASEQFLAIGSEQGYVWILDLHTTKLVRELSVSILYMLQLILLLLRWLVYF